MNTAIAGAVLSTVLSNGSIDHQLTLMPNMKECEFAGKELVLEFSQMRKQNQDVFIVASYKCTPL